MAIHIQEYFATKNTQALWTNRSGAGMLILKRVGERESEGWESSSVREWEHEKALDCDPSVLHCGYSSCCRVTDGWSRAQCHNLWFGDWVWGRGSVNARMPVERRTDRLETGKYGKKNKGWKGAEVREKGIKEDRTDVALGHSECCFKQHLTRSQGARDHIGFWLQRLHYSISACCYLYKKWHITLARDKT